MQVHGRGDDEQVVIVHVGHDGPAEVARHHRTTPGSPQLVEERFPIPPAGAVDRRPRAKNAAEAGFLALGEGARLWVFIGSRLDRLYGDYVWWLCDRGADAAIEDWDSAYIFCNTFRQPVFSPLRPESVYSHLNRMKSRLRGLPDGMTPHWFRHTHATALLLSGTPLHVVSRRLGHRDVRTTTNTYGHVTDDAELAALADWQAVVRRWEPQTDE